MLRKCSISQASTVAILWRQREVCLPMRRFLQSLTLLEQVAGSNEFAEIMMCYSAQEPAVQDRGDLVAFIADLLHPFRQRQRKPVLGANQAVRP